MTTCANCGSAKGPFVRHELSRSRGSRVEFLPPVCAPTPTTAKGVRNPAIASCNIRRAVLDEHNEGGHAVRSNPVCPTCKLPEGVPA